MLVAGVSADLSGGTHSDAGTHANAVLHLHCASIIEVVTSIATDEQDSRVITVVYLP